MQRTRRSRLLVACIILGIIVAGWITRISSGYIANYFLEDAVAKGNIRFTDFALLLGADPCLENEYHVSMVAEAAFLGQYDIVKLLLQYGANPDIRDYQGDSSIDGVTDPRIVALLKQAMQDRKK